ncbi:Toxin RTX-I translocation ATP-binding protein [invertebrate metagenome]|uniref:Toxin RTX-I translocation ATP-binding protein n=1 Tax=invertebrate metagenome TaxID=1711999 RepID=A0A2H9T6T3_9ZZZZ
MAARPPSVGAFAKNLQDFESIRDFITSSTITTLVDLPFTIIILFVIFMLGGPVVVVPIVAMLLIASYSFIIQGPLRRSVEKTLRSSAQKSATLIETLSGMEALKIAQAESDIQSRWEKNVGHIANWGVKTKLLTTSATSFSAYVQQVANAALVITGVYLIAAGDLSMGGLIASVMLSGRCMAPMSQLAGLSTRYNQTVSALGGLNQIMEMPSERQDDKDYVHRPDLTGTIEFDGVDFTYPGEEIHALRGINFNIKAGERIAIIGRIGSGKTTIEKLILGLYEPEAGAIRIDGIDLRQINPSDLRSSIGCVPQDIHLFYGSIKDNITMGASFVDDNDLLHAATIAGVTEFADRHPQGLDMNVGERGQNLSGGQRQSIALARALLMKPSILLLDEPSSSMDNTTELRMKQQIREHCINKTLVLVTHKASMLDLVDRLIVVNDGQIVADGPKEQVHEALKQGKLKLS